MDLTACSISPVRDYCFLSAPDSHEVFIVERSGRVRQFVEEDCLDLPLLRQQRNLPFLCQLPTGNWNWQNGFLPILQIKQHGKIVEELLAGGDQLFRRNSTGIYSYPGEVRCSEQQWQEQIDRIARYWQNFFGNLQDIPGLADNVVAAWKSCFVQVFCAFWGNHVKYGVEEYGRLEHDGFPPTILAASGALAEYGNVDRARHMLQRYLQRFMNSDGTIHYYGTALAEYGGIFRLVGTLGQGEAGGDFVAALRDYLLAMIRQLRDLQNRMWHPQKNPATLLRGAPEADQRDQAAEYLHNNAQILRGLADLGTVLNPLIELEDRLELQDFYRGLQRRFARAVNQWRGKFTFLPFRLDQTQEIQDFTATQDIAYANYRYYPELLESGWLSREDAKGIIAAHFERNGSYHGLSVLHDVNRQLICFNHWPLASLGRGLLEYDEVERFHEILTAHFKYYLSPDIFTCYESCLPGQPHMTANADWCAPAQLVFPRLLHYATSFVKRHGETIIPGLPAEFLA